jgi:hypothetical protein
LLKIDVEQFKRELVRLVDFAERKAVVGDEPYPGPWLREGLEAPTLEALNQGRGRCGIQAASFVRKKAVQFGWV